MGNKQGKQGGSKQKKKNKVEEKFVSWDEVTPKYNKKFHVFFTIAIDGQEKGKIGIRIRNLFFQRIAYKLYSIFKKFNFDSKIKKPYVFHKHCFSRKSIYLLLLNSGFDKIRITNSPLTKGDPYKYVKYYKLIDIAKIICTLVSKIAYWASFGKLILGPSLLVWAEKPVKIKKI